MRWTIAQVADALGTRPGTGLNALARVAGVSIDSRAIRAGELFIAIHGPRHDGHDHVASALEGGAIAAVVAEAQLSRYAVPVRDRCIAVADTFDALKQLARAVRESWGGKIAGVTGSVGKTTTKEILAALLGAKLRVLKSEGNLNNEYGLPLTLFRLEETHQAAVLEMGMSRRGELARLASIARPDVGVVTRVSPAHLEFFASVDEIALAKRELIEGLNGRESTAVLNADDPRVAAFGAFAPGRVLTYGIEKPAFFMAQEIEDIGAAEAQSVFLSLRAPAMRGELLRFSNGSALINDSYNSSPAALQAMTELLAATPNFRRRILAAGEMRELGTASPQLHHEAGQFAAKTGKIDWIIGVAGDAAQIVEGAVAAGLPRARARFFAAPQEAAEFLAGFIVSGDVLLVKGSRGVKMEQIVESLIARHAAPGEIMGHEVRH